MTISQIIKSWVHYGLMLMQYLNTCADIVPWPFPCNTIFLLLSKL